jgi:lipoyl(octanoyl) transferase
MSANNLTKSKVLISHLGLVEYLPTWELQKNIAAELVNGKSEDTLLLLQHPSVSVSYTHLRAHETLS